MSDPVGGTGHKSWRRRRMNRGRSKGVSANSRIVPHRYRDEGDKGQWFRRFIRRREERFWRREADADR